MKENSRENLAANKCLFQLKLEETQKLLEDQHLSSLQKFCHEVNQITNSETLSSVDSLEAGDHEEPFFLLHKEPSSVLKNSGSPDPANLQSTHLRCFQNKLSFSKAQHINNWLINLDDPSIQNDKPFSDVSSQPNVLSSYESFNSKGKNLLAPNESIDRATNAAESSVSFVCSQPGCVQDDKKRTCETSNVKTAGPSSGAFKLEKPIVTKSPNLKLKKAWTATDSPKEKTALSDQGKYSELTEEDRIPSLVPAAMPFVLPLDRQSARPLPKKSGHTQETNTGQCSFKLGELKDIKEGKKYFNCYKQELPLFSDIFQATCIPHNSDSKDEQKIAGKFSSNVISNYDSVGQHKKIKYSIHESSGMKFIKSILKKESKYEHDYFKALVLNQGFKLGNKKAAAIRDSIELTKEKGKSIEIPRIIKKLRWFDDPGSTGKKIEGNNSLKNKIDSSQVYSQPFYTETVSDSAANIIHVPACTDIKKPKDDSVSENVTSSEGFGTDQLPLKHFFPSGYNFAKQYWPAPEKKESKHPGQNSDSRTQKAVLQRAGAKVLRRTRSAKAQPGFLRTNRKGIIIRPQSASKANTFSQAQSKLIIPHPPPQPPSNIRSGKKLQVSQCQSRMPEDSEAILAQNCCNPKHVLPAEHELSQWNQASGFAFSDVGSDSLTATPSLSCCSNCQTSAPRVHLSGTQKGTHRSSDYEEGQETGNVWKRQHNILGQRGKAAESPVSRRKQMTENKGRVPSEQKQQNPDSVGQKFHGQINNFGQTIQLSSSGPQQTTRGTSHVEQVSESTSEFLMAENLVKASVAEDEILKVLNSKQEQNPAPGFGERRQLSLCALSAEEQKVLQSIDRLNERLHYLQEIICRNPSIKNTLKTIPTLDRASSPPGVGSRLQREY
ncbi:centrosomal protein of 126 kDa isoform X2 [Sorex fumeus]|nr:centrosomal protein of 126 kDa isoform X2 [Sorex fumeus]XP_055970965.1 centrosomal protein of 126 kDa isoform X2 [Sorex fumeus]